MDTTSSYRQVRRLVRKGYKIYVTLGFGQETVALQKTDWLERTKHREVLTDYDGNEQQFYIDHEHKYVEFDGIYT